MIERSAILVAVLGTVFVAIWLWERRRGSASAASHAGLTLVTGPDCALCPLALKALQATGVPHRVIDVSHSDGLDVRALPTLLMIGETGQVEWRRTGRSAITMAARMAEGLA